MCKISDFALVSMFILTFADINGFAVTSLAVRQII